MGGVCIFTSGYTYENVRIHVPVVSMYHRTPTTGEPGRDLFLKSTVIVLTDDVII